MTNLDPLNVIETYFAAFREGVKRCREAHAYVMADWLDAYGRLARLRDPFLIEQARLKPETRNELSKVFEKDTFMKGMMDIRTHCRTRDKARWCGLMDHKQRPGAASGEDICKGRILRNSTLQRASACTASGPSVPSHRQVPS
jgi:hypothetical protein